MAKYLDAEGVARLWSTSKQTFTPQVATDGENTSILLNTPEGVMYLKNKTVAEKTAGDELVTKTDLTNAALAAFEVEALSSEEIDAICSK